MPNADLVLEGGGVKGVGLVGAVSVLEEHGYTFRRIAGTSAGAIVGALVAARISTTALHELMQSVPYSKFKDESMIDRFGILGKGLSLLFEEGVYEGKFLHSWLSEQLAAHNVRTFGDLRIDDDPETSLPVEKRYKLVVMAADLSLGRLIRLPWDYKERYDLDPDEQSVADAVRMSMSIPFFYEPVKMRDAQRNRTTYVVDGGLLSNFPIDAFDRTDGRAPRWPTFGVKLSARADAQMVSNEIDGPFDFAKALVATLLSAHEARHLDDPCVVKRTMFVDTMKVRSTDFGITPDQQKTLYTNGRDSAEGFLKGWDFGEYVKECRS
jgi:NTE family protein